MYDVWNKVIKFSARRARARTTVYFPVVSCDVLYTNKPFALAQKWLLKVTSEKYNLSYKVY